MWAGLLPEFCDADVSDPSRVKIFASLVLQLAWALLCLEVVSQRVLRKLFFNTSSLFVW